MAPCCFSYPYPRGYRRKASAKVLLFFDITKFFRRKMQKKCFFLVRIAKKQYLCSMKGAELDIIAYAHNGFSDKFGIPRQPQCSSHIETRIVFTPKYRVREALRGIDGFSHLWLIWGFSEHMDSLVRPGDRTSFGHRLSIYIAAEIAFCP